MRSRTAAVLTLVVDLLACVASACAFGRSPLWPPVVPLDTRAQLVDREKENVDLKILAQDGKPIYFLECYLNAYSHEDPAFDYSGDFECRLSSLGSKDSYSTLLTDVEGATRDWQSRGRFLIEELSGVCATYPEYGRIRHFSLRGMNLTIEVEGLEIETGSKFANGPWDRERIRRLNVHIKVDVDPTADSEIATPPKYLEPPRTTPGDPKDLSRRCETILMRR
jgi:hypothetical protein